MCSYCVLDKPVFERCQRLLHPELTPWWSFPLADGAHHKKPHSPTHPLNSVEHNQKLIRPGKPLPGFALGCCDFKSLFCEIWKFCPNWPTKQHKMGVDMSNFQVPRYCTLGFWLHHSHCPLRCWMNNTLAAQSSPIYQPLPLEQGENSATQELI